MRHRPNGRPTLGSIVVEYFRKSGWGVWLVLGFLFAAWDQLAPLALAFLTPHFPATAEWLEETPRWLLKTLALTALLAGPFVAFRRLRYEGYDVDRQLTQWRLAFWKAFREEWIEIFLGEHSRKTVQTKADELRALFDERKGEIQRGDLSRVSEMIPIARHYLPVLHQQIPRDSVAFPNAVEEIRQLCDLAERYMADAFDFPTTSSPPSAAPP